MPTLLIEQYRKVECTGNWLFFFSQLVEENLFSHIQFIFLCVCIYWNCIRQAVHSMFILEWVKTAIKKLTNVKVNFVYYLITCFRCHSQYIRNWLCANSLPCAGDQMVFYFPLLVYFKEVILFDMERSRQFASGTFVKW